jgi:hypothetical protein
VTIDPLALIEVEDDVGYARSLIRIADLRAQAGNRASFTVLPLAIPLGNRFLDSPRGDVVCREP